MFRYLIILIFINISIATTIPEKCCKPNQVYSECGANSCQNTCENPTLSTVCKGTCIPGCICKDGYVKNSAGECVLLKDCKKCQENEVFNSCGTACPLTCSNVHQAPLPCTANCVPGCFCITGFIRDDITGKCVRPKDCTHQIECKKPNTVFSECGANGCEDTCLNPTFSTYCKGMCVPGCICKDGYLKDDNGNCVLPNECKKCSGPHEVWTECGNNACQRNCDTFGLSNIACKPICTPGCICEWGYLRNHNGVCVKPLECGTILCPEPFTIFTDCVPCDNTCEIFASNGTCNFLVCNPGCTCLPGFYRNKKQKCVLPDQCDACGENEVLSLCDAHPCRNTCAAPDLSTRCRYVPGCYRGCICKDGYLKNEKGKCVPKKKCNTCTGLHEEFSKCDAHECQNTCKEPNRLTYCTYTPGCYPGCICKAGFLRDDNGNCVPQKKCFNCVGPNEKYTECGAHGCLNTCEKPNLITHCDYAPGCYPGCICKRGFLRDSFGICVPQENCVQCPGQNEEYSRCDAHGCQNTCAEPNLITYCDYLPGCYPGCICKQGFLRNDAGVCVAQSECNACVGPHEKFTECEAHACQNTCKEPNKITYCTFGSGCWPGCICEEGYLRNDNNTCVLQSECSLVCDDPNAEYLTCKRCVGSCENKNPICDEDCDPSGCYCKVGFIRTSESDPTCIEETNCSLPTCKDPNAEYLSCKRCVGSCDDKNPICTETCYPPGCYCKVGFIRRSDDDPTCIGESECCTP